MTMCTSARAIFTWIQLVLLCIHTNITPSWTRVKFQSNSLGELSLQTKRKMRKRTDSIINSAKKNQKKKLFSRTVKSMMITIVSTLMTPMMIRSSIKRMREERKKPLPLCLESTKESERQLKMIQCFSKMRFSQLSHFKERSGQTLKSLAVLHSSHKVHITTHAHLSATQLAQKKDLPWTWLDKVKDHKLNFLFQNKTLEMSSSTIRENSLLVLKTLVRSIATGNLFHTRLLSALSSTLAKPKVFWVLTRIYVIW